MILYILIFVLIVLIVVYSMCRLGKCEDKKMDDYYRNKNDRDNSRID